MASLQQTYLRRAYRFMLLFFSIGVFLVFAAVIYLGWSSSIITITPRLKPVSATFSVLISADQTTSVADRRITGRMDNKPLTDSLVIEPSSSAALTPDHAHGPMIIKNTTASAQPLVAGTRLRSPSGVIVRTTKRVDVPARGQATAEVVADPLGAEGEVGPGRFTIVALSTSQQANIYGQADRALTGGLISPGQQLALADLTAASNQIEKNIRAKFGQSEPGVLRLLLPDKVSAIPPADQPSAKYDVTVAMTGMTIEYDQTDLNRIISAELSKGLATGEEVVDWTAPEPRVNGLPSGGQLLITLVVDGRFQLSRTDALFQAASYRQLDRSAILQRLNGHDLIDSAEVKISPWWRRTTPHQANRIKIIIKPAAT